MAEAVRVPVLVITGPVGVGTSAVAAEVSDRLDAAGVAHALVDVDALRWCYLRPSADPYRVGLAMRNLAAVWDTFRAAGATGLVLADVVIARADLDRYREAVPGAEFTVVRLHAHPETLAARVGAREVIRRGAWYLLAIHNNRAPENKGKWTFLGGLIDPPDPSPEAALVRELREELGVDGRVLGEVERYPYRNDPGRASSCSPTSRASRTRTRRSWPCAGSLGTRWRPSAAPGSCRWGWSSTPSGGRSTPPPAAERPGPEPAASAGAPPRRHRRGYGGYADRGWVSPRPRACASGRHNPGTSRRCARSTRGSGTAPAGGTWSSPSRGRPLARPAEPAFLAQ